MQLAKKITEMVYLLKILQIISWFPNGFIYWSFPICKQKGIDGQWETKQIYDHIHMFGAEVSDAADF